MAEELSSVESMTLPADAGIKELEAFFKSEEEQTQPPPKTSPPTAQPAFKVPLLPLNVFRRPLPMLMPPAATPAGGYHCGTCLQTFFSFPQLVRHKQFHDEERPFPCGICGKRFLSRSHYNEHQRVHTGERPFPCDQCERSFTTHHNLKRHMSIHGKEENNYRCKTCGVLFCQRHFFPLDEYLNAGLPEPGLPDLEHDFESDLEPLPQQKDQLEPLALAPAMPAENMKPELKTLKYDFLHQYRVEDRLQKKLKRKLQKSLKRKLNDPGGHSSTTTLVPLPRIKTLDVPNKKKQKIKKEGEKRRKSSSVPVSLSSGPARNRPNPNLKQHRIAYDIEVVL